MDFDLGTEQLALQDMVRRFCDDRFPPEVARASADGVDRGRWKELADLGLFGLVTPEAQGGTGLGLADAVIAFEELGRVVAPGPLVATFLAAAHLDGTIDGSRIATLLEAGAGPGQPVLVEHLAAADTVLVVADDGVTAVEAGAVTGDLVPEPLDPTTPLTATDALPTAGGEILGGPDLAAEWRHRGALLTAAMLVGNAKATTDLAVAYAAERHQFGRPIGSFQALKHLMADMFVRTEVARASVYSAAVMTDDPDLGDPDRARSGARALAGLAALQNARTCIQVHGGIGFTWEATPHLYLKRAFLHDTQFGSVDESAEAVAAALT